MPRRFSLPDRSLARSRAGSRPSLLALAAALLVSLSSTLALAAALDGVLQVGSAYVNFDHGVIQLYARVQYPLNPAISTFGAKVSGGIDEKHSRKVLERIRRYGQLTSYTQGP